MAEGRQDRIGRLFEEALALPVDQRVGFLNQACGGDTQIRAELESLLQHHNQADEGFLRPLSPAISTTDALDLTVTAPPSGTPTAKVSSDADPRASPNAPQPRDGHDAGPSSGHMPPIDGYEFVRELSRGGQGIVYQAVERATKRKVAIKVLLEGPYASKSAQKRFEREIELVAQLRHPNIISIFHSGTTPDGRAYFVMDYVRGVPLHTYVRDNKLALEETLRLFATVCEGMQHSHQKGVIHRDLKPSNILVDSEGVPKIMDFGLAKLMVGPVETLVSLTGQVMGTLPYMSPEQARGNPDEIDTRTDVYALGVILYELLTGHYPYPVAGQLIDVLNHITQTPPTPPTKRWTKDSGVTSRSSTKRLRVGQCPIDDEVQSIVMQALEKRRERRYQSAGELSGDIQRYLNNEPIEARRGSPGYLFRKMVRRYKGPVAAITALTFATGIAAGILTYMSVWYLDSSPNTLYTYRMDEFCRTGVGYPGADEVRLLARNNKLLKKWGGTSGSIRDALFFDRHRKWGGKVALIGFGLTERDWPGEIVAFDANNPDNPPLWRDKIKTPDDLPSIEIKNNPSRWDFAPDGIWQLDVFPDNQSPGDEVITVFTHRHSMHCLRIYDQNGEILYDLWHDGPMTDLRWLAKSKRLVILGQDDTAKQKIREANPGHSTGVFVLFAMEPRFGLRHNEVLMSCPDFGTVAPVWTRYFHPAVIDGVYEVLLAGNTGSLDDNEHVRVSVQLKPDPALRVALSLNMFVDEHGNEVPSSRNLGDAANDPASAFFEKLFLSNKPPEPPNVSKS